MGRPRRRRGCGCGCSWGSWDAAVWRGWWHGGHHCCCRGMGPARGRAPPGLPAVLGRRGGPQLARAHRGAGGGLGTGEAMAASARERRVGRASRRQAVWGIKLAGTPGGHLRQIVGGVYGVMAAGRAHLLPPLAMYVLIRMSGSFLPRRGPGLEDSAVGTRPWMDPCASLTPASSCGTPLLTTTLPSRNSSPTCAHPPAAGGRPLTAGTSLVLQRRRSAGTTG